MIRKYLQITPQGCRLNPYTIFAAPEAFRYLQVLAPYFSLICRAQKRGDNARTKALPEIVGYKWEFGVNAPDAVTFKIKFW